MKFDQICVPKSTKSSLAECVFVFYVRVFLSSSAADPERDKQFRKWKRGRRACSSARQMESNASRKQPDQPWLANQ